VPEFADPGCQVCYRNALFKHLGLRQNAGPELQPDSVAELRALRQEVQALREESRELLPGVEGGVASGTPGDAGDRGRTHGRCVRRCVRNSRRCGRDRGRTPGRCGMLRQELQAMREDSRALLDEMRQGWGVARLARSGWEFVWGIPATVVQSSWEFAWRVVGRSLG
jgi:hypothetical protein